MRSRVRVLAAGLAVLLLVVPLGWMWWSSLLPDQYSVMDMGYVDLGGGSDLEAAAGHAGMHAGAMSIASLSVDPSRRADVRVDLVARKGTFELASGEAVDGFTLNGSSPGPTIRAAEGDLVEVRLDNESVEDGVTLHWHGLDVPNSMDGVAGVTQDAVLPGGRFTYRFVAAQVGTFWYHSHQVSHEQVKRGLLGAVVITPRDPDPAVLDVVALSHLYDGLATVNGEVGDVAVEATPGQQVRVRVVNTDNGPKRVWVVGAPYTVLAVDGTDLHGPTALTDTSLTLAAGGRYDLGVVMPEDGSGVRVQIGGGAAVLLGEPGVVVPEEDRPTDVLDLLGYGTPADLGFDPEQATRRFDYIIDRRPGFLDGKPGLWWTVNGNMFPNVPMYTVTQGDVVVMHIENHSGEVHPMHLHGHHAVVLSRDGVPSTGSPWWVDSLDVDKGESFDIAFVADNPGVWMDHCHNLPHAAEGLVAHLMYAGFSTPFTIGGASANEPE